MKENCEETSRLSYDTVERKIIRKMNGIEVILGKFFIYVMLIIKMHSQLIFISGFLRIRNLQIKSIQYIVVK
ncbi:hypothetical protein RhiirC2_724986 [Rhizophagus irregularis]|uniref:Uncharacterized protein n=1 Tax=Rhizophagus irregularis TaxID=588596 RepID=A0A2N1P2D9_9GLOM|nr:hypothetical protein RhiirC2_724986 [Rhizophagus irregularis]